MIARWDPLKDILNLSDRVNNIFRDVNGGESGGQWTPPVDIYENDDELVILAELPGVAEDSIDIQVNDGLLLIRGEKQSPIDKDSESYYRLERPFGKFARSFSVPSSVDVSKVSAALKDGVLTVVLKKDNSSKSVTIKVTKD
ncbi:Hsp20/alpha crystallin family protein [Deferribacterales bacterium RsTz2092]|nr:Hsp20/alpha crystallin family protein [Deferribacterales bacterium]